MKLFVILIVWVIYFLNVSLYWNRGLILRRFIKLLHHITLWFTKFEQLLLLNIVYYLKGCFKSNNSRSCTKFRYESIRIKNSQINCLDTCFFGYIKDNNLLKNCKGKVKFFLFFFLICSLDVNII